MFPIALSAGVTTGRSSQFSSSTKRGTTPASTTSWIFSLVPSVSSSLAHTITYFCIWSNKFQQGLNNTSFYNKVSELGAITSNISQRPHCLLRHIVYGLLMK
ncbi:hypothetical protein E2C01_019895 [Portunus trituberculatus]|uniref:Uncharacterized protein n=1 Tax=Portunus trituberculatus TaxID=210409 RepID=A0A5B7E034_PORTR|nr:hypothetical protein [Portunus trituberculatus]